MQYFYDAQIRRFVLQFIRYFSGFQVEYGQDANGNAIYLTVPVRYADTNRAVSALLKNNSENTLQNVPMMVVYIDNLKYNRTMIQDPTYIEKRSIRERATDPNTGELKTYQKNALTVERMMPVPYRLDLKLDIYTSNIEQKLQLLEQIAVMFNPSLEIQSTENFLDWTSLSVINLVDTNFTSRTIPVGTDEPIDVATMAFEIPIFITPPAKVKKLDAVTGLVVSLFDGHGNVYKAIETQYELMAKRQWFTPSGYDVVVADGQVRLTQATNYSDDLAVPTILSNPIPWRGVINYVGEITNGISMMAFVNEDNGNTVVGTISYHPTDNTILLFNIDPSTIPTNTQLAVDSIIDPLKAAPNKGLPAPAAGQRYLLINNNIGNIHNEADHNPLAWRNADNSPVIAHANDIIEYNGSSWTVSYSGQNPQPNVVEYVTNIRTGLQYKYLQGIWQKSWEGLYREGLWLLVI
jgi:hypothetical protein